MKKNLLLGAAILSASITGTSFVAGTYATGTTCSINDGAYTDLAVAVNAASSGDELTVSGTCTIDSTIQLTKKLSIVGADDDAAIEYDAGDTEDAYIIKFSANSAGSNIENLTFRLDGTGEETIVFLFDELNNSGTADNPTRIYNNTIIGGDNTPFAGIGFYRNPNTNYVDIVDNWIVNFQHGIAFESASNLNIIDNGIINTSYSGIFAICSDTDSCKDIVIRENGMMGISSANSPYVEDSAGISLNNNVKNTIIEDNEIAMLNNKLPIFVGMDEPTIVIKNNKSASKDSDFIVEGLSEFKNSNAISSTITLTEAEEAKIKDALSGAQIVQSFDISLYSTDITGEITTPLTDLEGKQVTFSKTLPTNLPAVADGYTRTFYVARIHDGAVDILDATVRDIDGFNPETFEPITTSFYSFSSDLFSTFALIYVDTPSIPDSGFSTAETSSASEIALPIFATTTIAAALLFVASKKFLKR